MAPSFTTLIDTETLANHLDSPNWVIVDCSYDLADKNAGRNSYLESHIKGAVFANVHGDLSGPPCDRSRASSLAVRKRIKCIIFSPWDQQ